MAADFAVPSQQPFNTSPHNHYTLFGLAKPTTSSSSSPQSGLPALLSPGGSAPSTPHNASPDSSRAPSHVSPFSSAHNQNPHHLPFQTRQLRPPKSPLYMPAVLRPNEFPPTTRRISKPSPPSPPQSIDDRNSLNGSTEALKRRSTADSGKFAFGFGALVPAGAQTPKDESTESWGKISSLPTRLHWKADSESSICDEPTCTRYFTYFTRRHHCRRCGNIFCDEHSRETVPLDQDANFHPHGTASRACAFCHSEYKAWDLARWSRSNSQSSANGSPDDTPATPSAIGTPCKPMNAMSSVLGNKKDGTPESLAASVPRDWNWSTF